MTDQKFYYRFDPISIDSSDENEVRKYGRELNSLDDLASQFQLLKSSFDQTKKERADIINMLPPVSGTDELSVFHKIRFNLFAYLENKLFHSWIFKVQKR